MPVSSIPSQTRDRSFAAERASLAAAFRWAARLNWHEGIANHFSLAVSDDGGQFLMNPAGRHFSRMRASELLLLDADDRDVMNRPNPPDRTAWCIHGAMHRQVPGARCILHVHPKFATVLSTLEDSQMPPIDQNTMRFFNRIAIDDHYGGMGIGQEAERLPQVLAGKSVLVMGNHGVLVWADTVDEAFDLLYYFERACETLITAYSTGNPLRIVSDDVAEKTARQWAEYPDGWQHHFTALREILDEEEPDYKD
ncbi:MAG: class II aldolase/adducin family protein [Gammaproteobacteria bacterium]|nr:class II aldolase/adducin family protein [Gammaproteobacteria bacterium]